MDYCYDPNWDSFANDTMEENNTISTSAPTTEPTEDILSFSTTADDDGLTELVNLGWTPSETLYECQGDCDSDSDCDAGLLCHHNSIPPGCTGFNISGMDYCYDPFWNSFANETTEVNHTITSSAPTTEPTENIFSFSTTADDGLTELVNLGWTPSETL